MNWQALGIVPPIFLGVMLIVLLWGVGQMWKVNQKFLSFVFLALAVAIGILIYSLYGHYIFG